MAEKTYEEVVLEIARDTASRLEFSLLHGRTPSEAELADFRPKYESACAAGMYGWILDDDDGDEDD